MKTASSPTSPTITDLIAKQISLYRESPDSGQAPVPQSIRNRKSLLLKVLDIVGLSENAPARNLLGQALATSLSAIDHREGLTPKMRAELRSCLRFWSAVLDEHFEAPPEAACHAEGGIRTQKMLSTLLRASLKQKAMSQHRLAELSEVSLSTIERWVTGKGLPDARSYESLRAVERVLGLENCALNVCLSGRRHERVAQICDPYSEYLKQRRQMNYRLQNNEVEGSLRAQWLALLQHKCDRKPTLKRKQGSGWSTKEDAGGKSPQWFEKYKTKVCATASNNWNRLASFLGQLRLPDEAGGLGVSIEQLQTMAWLVVPEAVEGYLEWHASHAGASNGTSRNICQFVASLCAQEVGWLWQQPELAQTLPADFRPADWHAACAEVVEIAADYTKCGVQLSRDPFVGLKYYLDHDDPASPVLQAIRDLELEADSLRPSSPEKWIALRDAALLALLLLAPLRRQTLCLLKVGARGHLTISGTTLSLKIPPEMLKNGKKRGAMHVDVESPIVRIIQRYIDEARPMLLGGKKSDWVFVSSRHPERPWSLVSVQVKEVTRNFCQGNGIPLHSFRHLVATRHLRAFPGDYLGVQALLHDSLATVVSAYAPKDPTRAFAKHGGSLAL